MSQKAIGVFFFLLGIGICLLDPVITLKCTRAEGPEAACVLTVRPFGVVPLAEIGWQGVTGVALSSNTWNEAGTAAG